MSPQQQETLRNAVRAATVKIGKYKDRSLGEQNTKASLIDPVLEGLGWDIHDPDEVHREFRPTPKDCPVDYALKLIRKPRLFIEAKGLGEDLADRKWVAQVLGYATVAGVEWCVLTDGDCYRLYNASAAVDAEEKMLCTIRLSEGDGETAVRTLDLISRSNMEENLLDVLWNAHFVDRRVKASLAGMVTTADKALVRLIRRKIPKLSPKEVADSLRRLDIRIESVVVQPPTLNPSPKMRKRPDEGKRRGGKKAHFDAKLSELIQARCLSAPLKLFRKYKGVMMEAVLLPNGMVEFQGKQYDSCSTPAEIAVAGRAESASRVQVKTSHFEETRVCQVASPAKEERHGEPAQDGSDTGNRGIAGPEVVDSADCPRVTHRSRDGGQVYPAGEDGGGRAKPAEPAHRL